MTLRKCVSTGYHVVKPEGSSRKSSSPRVKLIEEEDVLEYVRQLETGRYRATAIAEGLGVQYPDAIYYLDKLSRKFSWINKYNDGSRVYFDIEKKFNWVTYDDGEEGYV